MFKKWAPKIPITTEQLHTETFVAKYKAVYRSKAEYMVSRTVYDSENVYAMHMLKVPVNPTAEGYMFKGWKVEGSDKIVLREGQMQAGE